MTKEDNSLLKNNTWELVHCPQGNNVVKQKWVYMIKFTSNGVVNRNRDRFIVMSFSLLLRNLY
jgi:hypothetical protein